MPLEPLVYPFTAIIGQNKLKTALLLNAVNPKIGGLLIKGQKGTGKSTSVRALADLLPEIKVAKGCPFNCNPDDLTNMCESCFSKYHSGEQLVHEKRKMRVITLPISATEDRVIGSLDIEKAIKLGISALEPGILAEANQNILYVDEVNLLPDHIADDILDAAASGWNIVQREGVSVSHPSRFILIGTMNPEEGELRPQLLDRFALSVTVSGIYDEKDRVKIIKNNLRFGERPMDFRKTFEKAQEILTLKVIHSMEMLSDVHVSDLIFETVARACIALNLDGHRPDIVAVRAAKTFAAFEGRKEVMATDLLEVTDMAICHRTRSGGLEEPGTPEEVKKTFLAALNEKGLMESPSL